MNGKMKKTLLRMVSIVQESFSDLTRKNWLLSEVFQNYEEYHVDPKISLLTLLRTELTKDWIKPNSTVLDIGCGEGFTMEFLSKSKKCEVAGIDISQTAIQKARLKGLKAKVRDIDQGLGLVNDEKYDYILFIEVLEHVKYPHNALEEACHHANIGVIVTIPNSGYLKWRLHILRGYFPRQTFTHLHFWTINDFHIFLRQIGLKPIDLKTDLDGTFLKPLRNLLAYQQCWLIASKR